MPGSSAQVGTPSAILRPQDLPPSPDPLVDLSALVVRMHTSWLTRPWAPPSPTRLWSSSPAPSPSASTARRSWRPCGTGKSTPSPGPAPGSGGGPTSAHGPEKMAEESAPGSGGPDAVTSADTMIGTGLYRLVYLGTTPSLEKVFTVAEAVAGHPCHDPPRSEDRDSGPHPGTCERHDEHIMRDACHTQRHDQSSSVRARTPGQARADPSAGPATSGSATASSSPGPATSGSSPGPASTGAIAPAVRASRPHRGTRDPGGSPAFSRTRRGPC